MDESSPSSHTFLSNHFIYTNIGPAAFAGLAAVLLLIPLQSYFSNRFSAFRKKMAKFRVRWCHTLDQNRIKFGRTQFHISISQDDRIRSLSDIIMGIELVKLSAWESPMVNSILKLREKELKLIAKSNRLRAMNVCFVFFWSEVISVFSFIVYWKLGNQVCQPCLLWLPFGMLTAPMS
jgi:ATP-binding cassette subfamily C (CFTR/MRP) protein 4